MSNKLCCIAEDRSFSPDLPNTRLSVDCPGALNIPPHRGGSKNSRFTSARTEDLQELQLIFQGAQENDTDDVQYKKPSMRAIRPRTSKHLPRSRSIQALTNVRNKLSKKLSKSKSSLFKDSEKYEYEEQSRAEKFDSAKRNIRQHLLSSKRRDEGGYDSDARTLEDIPKRISRMPRKRNSIHSVEWGSPNPETHASSSLLEDTSFQIPQISISHSLSLSNLLDPSEKGDEDTNQRRPKSTRESVDSENESTITVIKAGALNVPSQKALEAEQVSKAPQNQLRREKSIHEHPIERPESREMQNINVNGGPKEARRSIDADVASSRGSIHLYNMRISQHLRSPSSLSGMSSLSRALSQPESCNRFNESGLSPCYAKSQRQQRRTSTSGFCSAKVPSNWGSVVDDASSSIYSSRPNSRDENIKPCPAIDDTLADTIEIRQPIMEEEGISSSEDDLSIMPKELESKEEKDTLKIPRSHAERDEDEGLGNSLLVSNSSSSSLGRASRFQEDLREQPSSNRLRKRISAFNLLRTKLNARSSSSEHAAHLDGPADGRKSKGKRKKTPELAIEHDIAVEAWEKAVKAAQIERSAFFLAPNKGEAMAANPFRQRSSSISRYKNPSTQTLGPLNLSRSPSRSVLSEHVSPSTILLPLTAQESYVPCTQVIDLDEDEVQELLGAWGRFPSHTRTDRNDNVGVKDRVATRDFATSARLNPVPGPLKSRSQDSLTRKKRFRPYSSRSRSMTFGKSFLKSYMTIFRSHAPEYQIYGHGHRSSVAAGGLLEQPELEILPPVFAAYPREEPGDRTAQMQTSLSIDESEKLRKKRRQSVLESSRSPQAKFRSKSSGDLQKRMSALDGADDVRTADAWSKLYESCVQVPPMSTDEATTSDGADSLLLRSSTTQSLPALFNHGKHRSIVSVMSDGSIRSSSVDLVRALQRAQSRERERIEMLVNAQSCF